MKASGEQTFMCHKLVISVMNKASTEIEILLLLLRSVKNKNVSLSWELNF